MADDTVACIDIGSSQICTIIARVADRRIDDILGVGEVVSRGVRKGLIVSIGDAADAIRESLGAAESRAGLTGVRVRVGFGGSHIRCSNPRVTVPTDRREQLVTESVMKAAVNEMEGYPFPQDPAKQVKVNTVPRQYRIDRVHVTKNPLKMRAYSLDYEAHIVAAGKTYMDNLLDCVKEAGVTATLGDFVANPLASGLAVLEPEDMDRGVILADIGGGTTGIAVYREGSIWHTASLAVGGTQITNDLAQGLSIPLSEAEELKKGGGGLYSERVDASRMEVIEKYKTTPEELTYMIRARVEEILRMILSRPPEVGQLPKFLVLTGGTAKLPGMKQFVEDELGLQARVGVPGNLPEGADDLADPAYAAAVGLLVWRERTGPFDGGDAGEGGGLEILTSRLDRVWQGIRSRTSGVIRGRPTAES